jgi:hypothetical protein
MSHRSVVQLLKDSAVSLSDNIQFGYGLRSDFNQAAKGKENTFVWFLPLTGAPAFTTNDNTQGFQKTWNCIGFFFRHNTESGDQPTEYKPILDDMDTLVDQFIHRLNDWSMKDTDNVGPITMRNFQQTPYIKADADILTGWWLSFQLTTPDDFIYCTPDNIEIYGNN